NAPPQSTERQSYDLLTEGFGAGFNGSMAVVVDLNAVGQPEATLAAVHDAVAADPGVATVDPPVVNPAGDTGLVWVTPATAPQDAATDELVTRLRTDVLPPVMAGTGTDALVTGETAMLSDVSAKLT